MPPLDHLAGAVHLSAMMRHLAIVAVALLGCKKSGTDTAAKGPAAPAIKVQTLKATKTKAPEIITLTGMVAADQRSEVTADTQGKVISVRIERGSSVKQGEPVMQLDVRGAAMSAREAQANLSAARAQKELADQECARTKALLEKGAITQSEYDRQMTQCRAAQDQVAATQARTDMMAKSVADGLVRAPFEGVVAERDVSPGEWVQPGKPLFTLVKVKPLKMELSVPEKVIQFIQPGAHVDVVAVAYPDKTYDAAITRVGAEIGRARSLIVEAQIDDHDADHSKGDGLIPGMFAEAHVVIGEGEHVVLPATAVAYRNKRYHVFVVTNGEAEDDIVQLSAPPKSDQPVTVLQGVKEGDKVIAKVTDQIVDGTKVTE
jgi:membrane fusion protein (multidrug efflux system)